MDNGKENGNYYNGFHRGYMGGALEIKKLVEETLEKLSFRVMMALRHSGFLKGGWFRVFFKAFRFRVLGLPFNGKVL